MSQKIHLIFTRQRYRFASVLGLGRYVNYDFARKAGLKVSALAAAELPDNLRAYVPDPAGPDSYPIVTLTWILLYQNYPDASRAKAPQELFRWCLMDGQKYAPELGYVPLPPSIAMRSLARLDAIRAAEQ